MQRVFIDRFSQFISLLETNQIIPPAQTLELKLRPDFNPRLNIEPQDWWKDCFDWFVAVPVIRGGKYGPFYRIDGDHFWPTIGSPSIEDSERKCFFGLERPSDREDARRLYAPRGETRMECVHEFTIAPETPGGMLFMGPVRNAAGYQVNPNGIVVDMIRSDIVVGKVTKGSLAEKAIN